MARVGPSRIGVALGLIALFAGSVSSAAPRTGAFDVTFTERAKSSGMRGIASRFKAELPVDYDLSEERFQVYVPESYDGSTPFGVFVWISPMDRTTFRDGSMDLFRERSMISVAALNAGNAREAFHRIGLALDAVHNLSQRYAIDPERVYVGGFSGGGRISSMAAMHFPEVFRGWFSVCGVNYYARVQDPDKPDGTLWSAFTPPSRKRLARVKASTRAVLLTGEDDFNLRQTRVFRDRFLDDGFRHVLYLEVPGMGHAVPIEGGWFSRALDYLDGRETETPGG